MTVNPLQVCGGFSQWTPRLAEALYYECVPIILSPMMLPPWSGLLDWSTFSVRLEPTRERLATSHSIHIHTPAWMPHRPHSSHMIHTFPIHIHTFQVRT